MSQFEKTSDNTILDHETGLKWQAEPAGPMTWDKAMEYAKNLDLDGYNDWQLPSRPKLESLLDLDWSGPASQFPGTPNVAFWSSSVIADTTNYAWAVGFSSGYVDSNNLNNTLYVRCVRRGPLKLQRFETSERAAKLEAKMKRLRKVAKWAWTVVDRLREAAFVRTNRIAELEANFRRLAWVLQFMQVEDVGDEHLVPGVRTRCEEMDDELFGGLGFNATVLDFIDQAIDRADRANKRERDKRVLDMLNDPLRHGDER